MLTQILCSCGIPPAGSGPCYSDTILKALPSSFLPLLPPSSPQDLLLEQLLQAPPSLLPLKRQQVSQPLKPSAETGYSIWNELPEMRPGDAVTDQGVKCRTIWKHFHLGELEQEESVYFLNKWSSLSPSQLSDTPHSLACPS